MVGATGILHYELDGLRHKQLLVYNGLSGSCHLACWWWQNSKKCSYRCIFNFFWKHLPSSKCKTYGHIFSTFSMDGFFLSVFSTFWSQNWQWFEISEIDLPPHVAIVACCPLDINRGDNTACWYHNSFFGRYLRKYLQLLNELGQLFPALLVY